MTTKMLILVLGKQEFIQVRKQSSKIILCSPHSLIWNETFCLNFIFSSKRLPFNKTITAKMWSLIILRASQANSGRHFTHMQ